VKQVSERLQSGIGVAVWVGVAVTVGVGVEVEVEVEVGIGVRVGVGVKVGVGVLAMTLKTVGSFAGGVPGSSVTAVASFVPLPSES